MKAFDEILHPWTHEGKLSFLQLLADIEPNSGRGRLHFVRILLLALRFFFALYVSSFYRNIISLFIKGHGFEGILLRSMPGTTIKGVVMKLPCSTKLSHTVTEFLLNRNPQFEDESSYFALKQIHFASVVRIY